MERKKVNEIIKEAINSSELTKEEIAKKIRISYNKLLKIEAGEKEISPKILKRLSKVIDIDYEKLMYMIGEGLEVSPLNVFIKSYYEKLNLEELKDNENATVFRFNSNKQAITKFKKIVSEKGLNEYEKEFIIKIIDDLEYQNNSIKEILKLIKSLKIRREKKCKNMM
jgi:transcriptional regulator with XRE-family HTH domain